MADPAAKAKHDEYRRRVVAVYQAYAPAKLGGVDRVLEKYAGQEETLMAWLVSNYGPEPTTAPPAATASSSPSRVARESSIILPSNELMDLGPIHTEQSMIVRDLLGPDPYDEVKKLARANEGFASPEHEHLWEQAWLCKSPFALLEKQWKEHDSILLANFANKVTAHNGEFKRTKRRFFVLVPPLLYYFDNNVVTTLCRGAVYLVGASVAEDELGGKPAIEITPRSRHKPMDLDPKDECTSVKLQFENQKLHMQWLNVLTKTAAVTQPAPELLSSRSMRFLPNASMRQADVVAAGGAGLSASVTFASPSPGGVPTSTSAQTFAVTADSIKSRLRRLASDRDPAQFCNILLEAVCEHVQSAASLWQIMEQLEEVPRKEVAPTQSPTPSDAQDLARTTLAEISELKSAQVAMERRIEEQLSALVDLQGRSGAAQVAVPSSTLAGAAGLAGGSGETLDPEWDRRMARLRERKVAVDAMLQQLPS